MELTRNIVTHDVGDYLQGLHHNSWSEKKLRVHSNIALDVSNMVEENMVILFSFAFATTYRLLLW
jgi:hypothetical protein